MESERPSESNDNVTEQNESIWGCLISILNSEITEQMLSYM